jgi:hypothetical protein
MWFELDDSLEDHPTFGMQEVAALEAIAVASFSGQHVLYGSRSVLSWALKQPIGIAGQAAMRRAINRISEFGMLRKRMLWRVIFVANGKSIEHPSDDEWRVPIGLITFPLHAADLLAENLNDARAYQLAAKHFQTDSRLNSLRFKLSLQNGGGAEIVATFAHCIESRERMSITITDSDKKHPLDTECPTSRNCAKLAKSSNWICIHKTLPCREIENLLPWNLVQDSIENSGNASEISKLLDSFKFLLQNKPDALDYVDIKEGEKGYLARGILVNPELRAYWSGVVKIFGNNCNVSCIECIDRDTCKCLIIPGLGPKVLTRFIEYCAQLSTHKQIERVRTSPQNERWLRLGEAVFNWGIADEPCRA